MTNHEERPPLQLRRCYRSCRCYKISIVLHADLASRELREGTMEGARGLAEV